MVKKTLKMLLSFLLVIFDKYVRDKRRKKERKKGHRILTIYFVF